MIPMFIPRSKVKKVEKLKSGEGYFVTLENGAGRYVTHHQHHKWGKL